MSQKCSECGRETPLGQRLQHYWDCEHETTTKKPLLSTVSRGNHGDRRKAVECNTTVDLVKMMREFYKK